MRRYFFHLRCNDRVLFDDTGRLLVGLSEAASEAERIARSCFARFGIPFRLLLFDINMGYAPSNNIGDEHARGQCL